MKYLFVLHDPPYGTERTYNGIRWARQLLDADPVLSDAVGEHDGVVARHVS